MKTWVFGILSLLTIGGSFYMLGEKPEWNNQLTNFLANILVATFTVFVGLSLNEKSIKKAATDKWMPAAESACRGLITISAAVKRLQNGQGAICEQLEQYLPNSSQGQPSIKTLMENKCKACTDSLTNISTSVDRGIKDWEVFLGSNCEKGECEQIQNRLDDFMTSCFR